MNMVCSQQLVHEMPNEIPTAAKHTIDIHTHTHTLRKVKRERERAQAIRLNHVQSMNIHYG